jgi:hypothetical protein
MCSELSVSLQAVDMKFSVRMAARKWSCGGSGCDQWPIAVLATVLVAWAAPASAYSTIRTVPLPQPRPAEAPGREDKSSPGVEDKSGGQKPAEVGKPAAEAPPAPVLSACRLALTENIAIAPSIPSITGPGGCGGDDLVRLEAVVLPDTKGRVAVKPAAVLRCTMASAIADWIRTDMAPLAEAQGTRLSDLDNYDSYDCRGRNGVVGAILSEHGHANALDVRALKLANGGSIALTDRSVAREVRESVLHSVCKRFTTVLGPGSDGYHEEHIHLDLAERRSGYRICQWEVWDPLPVVAPLLPAERPEEAPPRKVAEKADDAEPAAAPAPSGGPLPVVAPLLPAERPEQAPPRQVAEKADARPAAASTPPKAAALPPAAEAHHPKPKPRKRRMAPRPFISLFRFR